MLDRKPRQVGRPLPRILATRVPRFAFADLNGRGLGRTEWLRWADLRDAVGGYQTRAVRRRATRDRSPPGRREAHDTSARNVLRSTLNDFGSSAGFIKNSGAWYRRQGDAISVVDLQKSQYGNQYYINVGLWLLEIADERFPKEWVCHLRTRLEALLPPHEEPRLEKLLDLRTRR